VVDEEDDGDEELSFNDEDAEEDYEGYEQSD